ncbi:hypothetical protein HanRHA438_Chr09g0374981 [Helianthus annuus]|nr:hypothetical protein HanRHA438_Chr09g0374981 [Helianthus annuus]
MEFTPKSGVFLVPPDPPPVTGVGGLFVMPEGLKGFSDSVKGASLLPEVGVVQSSCGLGNSCMEEAVEELKSGVRVSSGGLVIDKGMFSSVFLSMADFDYLKSVLGVNWKQRLFNEKLMFSNSDLKVSFSVDSDLTENGDSNRVNILLEGKDIHECPSELFSGKFGSVLELLTKIDKIKGGVDSFVDKWVLDDSIMKDGGGRGKVSQIDASVNVFDVNSSVGFVMMDKRKKRSVRNEGLQVKAFKAMWGDNAAVKILLDEDVGSKYDVLPDGACALEMAKSLANVGCKGVCKDKLWKKVQKGGFNDDARRFKFSATALNFSFSPGSNDGKKKVVMPVFCKEEGNGFSGGDMGKFVDKGLKVGGRKSIKKESMKKLIQKKVAELEPYKVTKADMPFINSLKPAMKSFMSSVALKDNVVFTATKNEEKRLVKEKEVVSYANTVRGPKSVIEEKIQYYPPKVLENGDVVAVISPEKIAEAKKMYSAYLYGYFIGKDLPLGFARVLVEVVLVEVDADADTVLPEFVKAYYPEEGEHPAYVKDIRIEYQLKVKKCSECRVFGHDFESCGKRILSEEEVREKSQKLIDDIKAANANNFPVSGVGVNGFATMGRKNKVLRNYDGMKYYNQGRNMNVKKVQNSGNGMGTSVGAGTSDTKNDKGEIIEQRGEGVTIKSAGNIKRGSKNPKQMYRPVVKGPKVTNKGETKVESIVKVSNSFEVLSGEVDEIVSGGSEVKGSIDVKSGLKEEKASDMGGISREKEVFQNSSGKEDQRCGMDVDANDQIAKEVEMKETSDCLADNISTSVNYKAGYFKMNDLQFNEVACYILKKECPPLEVLSKWNVGQKKVFQEQWDVLQFEKIVNACDVESEGDETAVFMKNDGGEDTRVLGNPLEKAGLK